MSFDPISVVQHGALLVGLYAFFWVWRHWSRFILKWSAVALFCCGAYGWAFLLFIIWCFEKNAHVTVMGKLRAAGAYNGPWID